MSTPDKKHLQELVSDYLEEALAEEEREELTELLRTSAEARRYLLVAAAQDDALYGLAKQVKQTKTASIHRVRAARRPAPEWFVLFAVAAAAVIAVSLFIIGRGREPSAAPVRAEVETVQYPGETEEAPKPEFLTSQTLPQPAAEPEKAGPSTAELRPPLPEGETPAVGPAPVPEPETIPTVAPENVPAEALQPAPAEEPVPQKTETAKPLGRLAVISGSIFYKRSGGKKWFKAAEGTRLLSGAAVDSRLGKALIKFNDGTGLYVNHHTVAVFRESRIELSRGEIYLHVAGRKNPLEVATNDGTVNHLGTRFSVKVTPAGTTVVVEEGKVKVENKKGRVEVTAGFQVAVHKPSAPGRPRKADTARDIAWTRTLQPPEIKGLVGHWPLDEDAGRIAIDASGRGNNGTLQSGVSRVSGVVGGALSFDGSDDNVTVNRATADLKPSSLTVAAWVKTGQSATFGWVAAQGDNYGLVVNRANNSDDVFFYYHNGLTWHAVSSGDVNVTDDLWHHIAATYTVEESMKVYKDGVVVGSKAVSGAISYIMGDGFTIGTMEGNRHFKGLIDDVRVYSRALSDAEIMGLHTQGRGGEGKR